MENNPTKVTPTEAKAFIRVSQDTLYKAMNRGKLPFEKTDKGRVIQFSVLQNWHEKVGDYGPLRIPDAAVSEPDRSDNRSDRRGVSGESSDADRQIALLELKVSMLEEQREREQKLIDEFKQDYRKFMSVLTDQRSEQDKAADKGKQDQAKQIEELTNVVKELTQKELQREKQIRQRKEREAQNQRVPEKQKKSWFKLLGGGASSVESRQTKSA